MSAVPIARYLLELDAGDDARAVPASRPSAGKPSPASKTAVLDEAHAKGVETGKAAAEALVAGKLEQLETAHRTQLASAREAWARQEGERLADQLGTGLEALEVRMAESTARILKPFLAAELQRKAIADLGETLMVLRAQDRAAVISVCGAADLLDAMRARLEGRLDNVAYHPNQVSDVRVTIGETVLETRIGAWMARIEEAMT